MPPRLGLILCLSVATTTASFGQEGGAGSHVSGKFQIDGTVLVFDTEDPPGDGQARIVGEDADKLLVLLRRSPDVQTLVLNSGGGSVWAGYEMARLVEDFQLDTHVDGECSSSCVNVFLAGQNRSLALGGKLGFHQNTWSARNIQAYYKDWYGDDDGWDTPFEFASWIYQDTQSEMYEDLRYMIDRGVDPVFAIETKRHESALWYPTRQELEDAGVLRHLD